MQFTIKLPLSNLGGFTNSSLSAAHEFLEIQLDNQELQEFFTHYSESTSSPHARTLFQSKVDAKLRELLAQRRSLAASIPATDSEAVSSDEFNVSGLGSQPESSCTSGASDADNSADDKTVVPEPADKLSEKKHTKASKKKRQNRKQFKTQRASSPNSPVKTNKDGAQKSKRLAALGREVVPRGTKSPQVEVVEEVDLEFGLDESRESSPKTELAVVAKKPICKVPFGPEKAQPVVLPPIGAFFALKAKFWFNLFSDQPVDRPFSFKARTIRSWFTPSVFEPFKKLASVQKAIEAPKNITVYGPPEKIVVKKFEGSTKVPQVLAFQKAQYFHSKRLLSFENLFSQYKVNWPKATKILDFKTLPVPHTNNNLQVGQLSQYHEFMRLLRLSELSNPFRECLPLAIDKDDLPLNSPLPPPSTPKIVELKDEHVPSKRALKQRAKRQAKKEKKKARAEKAAKRPPRQFKSVTNSMARRERRRRAQRNREFGIAPPPRPQKIEYTPVTPVFEVTLTLPAPVVKEPVNHLQVGQLSQFHHFMKLFKFFEHSSAHQYTSEFEKVFRSTEFPLNQVSTVVLRGAKIKFISKKKPAKEVIYPIQNKLKLIEWVKEEPVKEEQMIYPIQSKLKLIEWVKEEQVIYPIQSKLKLIEWVKEEPAKKEESLKVEVPVVEEPKVSEKPKKVKKTPVLKPKISKAKERRERKQKAKRSREFTNTTSKTPAVI
ncbi:hypothetical protein FT662_03321 [Candidozyma haemuli var. vulneris]|uniref:Uncharacterized protein n=1 Tax=Candidozyma haemuli TaxID=45357 RepID=A0A2V1B126_9ASCO|nr:hypothetical protein CXQ85_003150 [[Candida] haemuloni]KAF3988576.1 hypothetical protein FT662_03321 [[Candida] haemuloni var. vulneris]PVH23413.1 hypothetical protein CXQ85_003150 [[Candida] haemuloni]